MRLIRQLLQRIVVPELHFDAPIECTTVRGLIRAKRPFRSAPVTLQRCRRQLQTVLHRERDSSRTRLGEPDIGPVNALVSSGQLSVIRITDKLDHDILLVAQIQQAPPHMIDEFVSDVYRVLVKVQRCNEVLYTRPPGMAFHVTELTNRLHAADFNLLDFVRNQEFLQRHAFANLVVPDLHCDAPVQCPAFFSQVSGHRLGIAFPGIGHRFRWQREDCLEMLGDLAGALPRETRIIAVYGLQRRRQRSIVRMTDQVQTHIYPILHSIENIAERLDSRCRYVCDTGFELNRWHQVA